MTPVGIPPHLSLSPDPTLTGPATYLGIDLGTSGCRGMAIDTNGQVLAEHAVSLPSSTQGPNGYVEQQPNDWWQASMAVLRALAKQLPEHQPVALAIDGTSSTVLLTDQTGRPLTPGLMYNDTRAVRQATQLADIAPAESAVHSASSSLAKLMWLHQALPEKTHAVCHQAEWIANRLVGQWGLGDENNCLKLGYDPITGCWPDWLAQTEIQQRLLPQVLPAGAPLGPLLPDWASTLGLPTEMMVIAGTTDSVAAALACGLNAPGDAATSLGTTLAIKLLSVEPVFAPEYGVYSHKVLGHWLAGGASNSGGAVLRKAFTNAEMRALEGQLNPAKPTGLNYYPLTKPGERFPINDPSLAPKLLPRPDNPVEYFQGMLEGIAAIEAAAYRRLSALGAPPVRQVFSTGGGAKNKPWRAIRQGLLGVPVLLAKHDQAAYGAALLARSAQL